MLSSRNLVCANPVPAAQSHYSSIQEQRRKVYLKIICNKMIDQQQTNHHSNKNLFIINNKENFY